MIKITFLFLCLLRQNVTVESVMTFNLSSSGECESLLCTRVCLYFWHFFMFYLLFIFCGNVYTKTLRTLFLFLFRQFLLCLITDFSICEKTIVDIRSCLSDIILFA